MKSPLSGFKPLLHPEESWSSLALLAFMFLVITNVVEEAKWVKEMPSLWGMALGALALGYVLAKIRVHSLLLHPVAIIVGLIVVGAQTLSVAYGDTAADRIVDVLVRANSWISVAKQGGISTDPMPFVIQVLVLIWIIGYISSWFIFRMRQVWLGVLPPSVGLVVNLNYLPGRFSISLALFLLAAVALIAKITHVQHQRTWKSTGSLYVSPADSYMLWSSVVMGLVVVALAWNMPISQDAPLMDTWDKVSTPWRSMEQNFDRLFASVSSGKISPLHSFNGALPLRGSPGFSDDALGKMNPLLNRYPVLNVATDEPGYMRGESYDVYTGKGWLSSDKEQVPIKGDSTLSSGSVKEGYEKRKDVMSKVEVGVPGDVLFSRGQPLYANIDSYAYLGKMSSYTISIKSPSENQRLPVDLQRAAIALQESLRRANRLPFPGEVQQLLPSDILLEPEGGISLSGREITSIKVFRSGPPSLDIWSLRSPIRQSRSQKYSIISSISVASADDLRQAGGEYPGWITERYLQLPDSLPARVKDLARLWTTGANPNAYDRASTIETRLRELFYDLKAPAPPRGQDGIDYFLFESKRGFSDYFASSMVVMLRSLGIPSRLAVGYVNGDYDAEKEVFVIREKHAHAWPEVFFPRYGWIEYNPTPAWPTIDRGGDAMVNASGESVEDDFPPSPFEEDELGRGPVSEPSGENNKAPAWIPLVRPVTGTVLLVMAGLLALYLLWTVGLSKLSFAAQTYEKMCRLAILARMGPSPVQTPQEYANSISEKLPSARHDINVVVAGYVKDNFGKKELTEEEKAGFNKSWAALRKELFLKALRWKGK